MSQKNEDNVIYFIWYKLKLLKVMLILMVTIESKPI